MSGQSAGPAAGLSRVRAAGGREDERQETKDGEHRFSLSPIPKAVTNQPANGLGEPVDNNTELREAS